MKKAKPRLVRIYRILLGIKNGTSSTKSLECAVIKTAGWEVRDVKFVDDDELVLAVSAQCKPAVGVVRALAKTSLSLCSAFQNAIPRNSRCLRYVGVCRDQRK